MDFRRGLGLPGPLVLARRGADRRPRQRARGLARGEDAAAVAPLRAAVAADDGHAEAHFRLAGALRRTGRLDEAGAEYLRALERGAFPNRELPELQAALRELADRRRAPLVDLVPPLEAAFGDARVLARRYTGLRQARRLGEEAQRFTPQQAQGITDQFRELVCWAEGTSLSREEFLRRFPPEAAAPR